MSWTLSSDFAAANHAPVAIVNDTCGPEFVHVPWKFPEPVVLDARSSWDPDNDGLDFEWWHYREATQRYGEGPITAVSEQFNITALDSTGGLVEIRPVVDNVNETAVVNAVSGGFSTRLCIHC